MLLAVILQGNRVTTLEAASTDIDVVTVEIVAHTPGLYFDSWADLYRYSAPQVPAAAQMYSLDNRISCPDNYKADEAWHEIIGSWPSIDIMYSVNASVTNEGNIQIALRTRQGFPRGYAYIDVLVLCRAERQREPSLPHQGIDQPTINMIPPE